MDYCDDNLHLASYLLEKIMNYIEYLPAVIISVSILIMFILGEIRRCRCLNKKIESAIDDK